MLFSASVLLPLYIYPSSTAWQSVFSSIEANPAVNFQIVVNPASGPGSSMFPDTNYVANIAKLNNYTNVETFGYVYTAYGQRPTLYLNVDIAEYAGWSAYSSQNIGIDGYFFDQAPASYDATNAAYMTSAILAAKNANGAATKIFLNAGQPVDAGYYALADYVGVYEAPYSSYADAVLKNLPTGLASKASFIFYDYPGDANAQEALVQQFVSGGIGSLYVASAEFYTISNLWEQFVEDVACADAGTCGSNTTSSTSSSVIASSTTASSTASSSLSTSATTTVASTTTPSASSSTTVAVLPTTATSTTPSTTTTTSTTTTPSTTTTTTPSTTTTTTPSTTTTTTPSTTTTTTPSTTTTTTRSSTTTTAASTSTTASTTTSRTSTSTTTSSLTTSTTRASTSTSSTRTSTTTSAAAASTCILGILCL